MHINTYAHKHVCTYARMHVGTCARGHVCTCARVCTCKRVHACTNNSRLYVPELFCSCNYDVTDEFQPPDITANRIANELKVNKLQHWYSKQIQNSHACVYHFEIKINLLIMKPTVRFGLPYNGLHFRRPKFRRT